MKEFFGSCSETKNFNQPRMSGHVDVMNKGDVVNTNTCGVKTKIKKNFVFGFFSNNLSNVLVPHFFGGKNSK